MTVTVTRAGAKPYGNVTYADPGYQKDKKARYPIDTAAHVKAAWSYINQADNAGQYSSAQLATIKGRIKGAAKKLGVTIDSDSNARPNLGTCVRAFDFESTLPVGDGRTLEGYAAVFNNTARIGSWGGDFDEIIKPGAFARSLMKRTPVLQFEHGRDSRVGAVPIGAIEDIHEDDKGLFVRARLYDNPVIEPVRQAIAGQSIKGMSFRFSVPEGGDEWITRKGTVDLRHINEADTSECGPVVFPAYDATSVSVRSILAGLGADERRALVRELADEVRNYTDLGAGSADDGDTGAESGEDDTPAVASPTANVRNRMLAMRMRGINV